MPNKLFYIIIDSLRYDALKNSKANKFLFPNINKLIKKGLLYKATANGQSTQFVLPSLFSLTYPLDYGGYNEGISQRPASYVECVKKSDYKTILFSNCNAIFTGQGYDRGFDNTYITCDFRVFIEQVINHKLNYYVSQFVNEKKNKNDVLEKIKIEFDNFLRGILELIKKQDTSIWPKKINKMNSIIARGCAAEIELLKSKPEIVLNKIMRVPGGMYWKVLGVEKYRSFNYFISRFFMALSWRFTRLVKKQNIWPFLLFSHHNVVIEEFYKKICKKIRDLKSISYLMHIHIMDLHDCRGLNRFGYLFLRLRYLPKWLLAKYNRYTNRHFVYDSSLMNIDRHLGIIFQSLEKDISSKDIKILLTADHGYRFAHTKRKDDDFGDRAFSEDIDIPFILSSKKKFFKKNSLCSSMDITATFLDYVGVKGHNSFKGKSLLKSKREFVITENCGRGNADIIEKDIYFAITSEKFKLFALLQGKDLKAKKLFHLIKDPEETRNLVLDKKYQNVKLNLLKSIKVERKYIFDLRNSKYSIARL